MNSDRPANLFRDRSFLLFWSAGLVSHVGSMVTAVALPLVAVQHLDATPFAVGLVTASAYAAWLLVGLPAGVWVDRVRRRPVMIAADLGRAVLMGSVPLAWALDALTVVQLVVVALLTGMLTVPFDLSHQAFLPNIVAPERLTEGNGRVQASWSAAMIGGPGLGGLLIKVIGAPLALLCDALSYLVSAALLTVIPAVEPPRPTVPPTSFRVDLAAGLRYLLGSPFHRVLAYASGMANFVFAGYEAVLFVFLARDVGLSGGLIGVLFGLGAAGGLVGALLADWIARRVGDARVMWGTLLITPLAGALIPLTHAGAGLAWYLVGAVLTHGAIAVYNTCAASGIQTVTPNALLGRVAASIRLFSRGALPIGAVVGGVLATALGARTAIAVLMVVLLLAPVWIWRSPVGRVRTIAELATKPSPVSHETVSGGAGSAGSGPERQAK